MTTDTAGLSSERTLILLRHGKSGYPAGVPDHERPLADRGRREAALAGEWIGEHAPAVDLVLCSSALRTRETFTATAIDAPVVVLDELYGASAAEYVDVVRAQSDSVRTVLLIGHQPSVSMTARLLAADRESEAALQVRDGYPTSGVAVLRVPTRWSQLAPGGADLVSFHVPR